MSLLKDEVAFLRRVTRGRLVPMPRGREKRLIVQILVSYRLIWVSGDHLIPSDRGVSVLANLARRRAAKRSEALRALDLSPEMA